MRLVWYSYSMRDEEHQQERIDLDCSNLGIDSPRIEGKEDIKKKALHFAMKFWWTIVHLRLSSTSSENILMQEIENLIACLMVRYDINFVRFIHLEIHIRAFGETTTLFLPYLIKQLCDVTEVLLT